MKKLKLVIDFESISFLTTLHDFQISLQNYTKYNIYHIYIYFTFLHE